MPTSRDLRRTVGVWWHRWSAGLSPWSGTGRPGADAFPARLVTAAVIGLVALSAVVLWPEGGEPEVPDTAAPEVSVQEAAGRERPPAGESLARKPTPHGEAAVELVIIPREIRTGGEVAFHLVNRGDVPLLINLPFAVERWVGDGWRELDPAEGEDAGWAWASVGVELQPGAVSAGQFWPVEPWGAAEPGRYRITKTATYQAPADTDLDDVGLRVTATFRVAE